MSQPAARRRRRVRQNRRKAKKAVYWGETFMGNFDDFYVDAYKMELAAFKPAPVIINAWGDTPPRAYIAPKGSAFNP